MYRHMFSHNPPSRIYLLFPTPPRYEQRMLLRNVRGLKGGSMATVPKVCVTCICIRQVELRPGEPWSAAVTVKAYSARSIHLRGEEALSSPVVGLRVKRSARAPAQVRFNTKEC